MSLLTDHQHGLLKESVYGTPVAVSRFLPMLASSSQDVNLGRVKSKGLIVGGLGYQRGARSTTGIATFPLQIDVPLQSKGIGALLEACAGTSAHTVILGAAYMSQFTPQRTTPTPTVSFTYQTGIVETTSAGASDPRTYAGVTVDSFSIECPADGEGTLHVKALAKSMSTVTALASASYAAAPTLYHHDSGSATIGTGAITAPTTTTVGSFATPSSTNIRSWSLDVNCGLIERPIAGGYNQPVWGAQPATVKAQIEYDGRWWETLMLANGAMSFDGRFTGIAVGASTETLQVFVPQMFIDPGVLPKPTEGDLTLVELVMDVEYNGTNQPWYINHITSDTAL